MLVYLYQYLFGTAQKSCIHVELSEGKYYLSLTSSISAISFGKEAELKEEKYLT